MTQYIGEDSFVLNPYNQSITINENFLGVTPETGDYVCTVEESLTMLLRGDIIYMQQNVSSTNPVYTLSLDSTASLEKYTS